MRYPGLIVLAAALLAAGGCNPVGSGAPRIVADVDVVVLEIDVAPITEDEIPGPDGLTVQVTFYRNDYSQPTAVSGELDLLLFENKVLRARLLTAKPLHTWPFTSEDLGAFAYRGRFGLWQYGMKLLWGTQPPRSRIVTVVARYRSGGRTILSAPSYYALAPQ